MFQFRTAHFLIEPNLSLSLTMYAVEKIEIQFISDWCWHELRQYKTVQAGIKVIWSELNFDLFYDTYIRDKLEFGQI